MTGGRLYELRFDGSCWPNPGGRARCGWAVFVHDPDEHDAPVLVAEGSEEVPPPAGGDTSNNVAEWAGLLAGLRWFAALRMAVGGLLIRGDSQLVINQLNGDWKAKKPWLAESRDACRAALKRMGHEWEAAWMPREQNAHCDALAAPGR